MIARRLDITESTVKVHVKRHAEENEAQIPRGSGGMGPPGANLLRRVRPGDAWRGKLDQRLGQRQGDFIGGDALPLFILHHHRQAPAVRGARVHCSTPA